MDFLAWQKAYAEQPAPEGTDEAGLDRIAVVTFREFKGSLAGNCRFGRVFKDRMCEADVKEGETWITQLIECTGSRLYRGKPLFRLDIDFMVAMNPKLVHEMAEYMWEYRRAAVMAALEPSVKAEFESVKAERDAIAETVRARLGEAIQKRDDRIAALEASEAGLRESLEAVRAEAGERIAALDAERIRFKVEAEATRAEAGRYQDEILLLKKRLEEAPAARTPLEAMAEKAHTGNKVFRTGEEELSSGSFRDGKYKGRTYADGSRMILVPDDRGNLECVDGVIRIAGLQSFRRFTGTTGVEAEFGEDGRVVLDFA